MIAPNRVPNAGPLLVLAAGGTGGHVFPAQVGCGGNAPQKLDGRILDGSPGIGVRQRIPAGRDGADD